MLEDHYYYLILYWLIPLVFFIFFSYFLFGLRFVAGIESFLNLKPKKKVGEENNNIKESINKELNNNNDLSITSYIEKK